MEEVVALYAKRGGRGSEPHLEAGFRLARLVAEHATCERRREAEKEMRLDDMEPPSAWRKHLVEAQEKLSR